MRGRRLAIVGLVLVVAVGAVVGTTLVMRSDEEDIFLEGANTVGPRPFTTIAATVPTTATTAAATTTTVASGETTTTALYGGSGSQKYCDPEALITFLTTHTDKATAWVGALNTDPTLQWTGGNKLTVADIPTYIHELTPGFLAVDTRVTNHGYFNGKATPHQSVLQAGTAVLVDRFGVPRARCACGNPLLPPKRVRHPRYHGDCWIPDTTTTTRRPRPTTTTSSSTTTSTESTSTSLSTTSTTVFQGPALGAVQLILARPSHRCGPGDYCSPPGCVATTLPETTTTAAETTTTTVGETTTTCVPIVGGPACGSTRRPGSTATAPPPTSPPKTVVTTPPSTTRTTQRPATTTTRRAAITSTTSFKP